MLINLDEILKRFSRKDGEISLMITGVFDGENNGFNGYKGTIVKNGEDGLVKCCTYKSHAVEELIDGICENYVGRKYYADNRDFDEKPVLGEGDISEFLAMGGSALVTPSENALRYFNRTDEDDFEVFLSCGGVEAFSSGDSIREALSNGVEEYFVNIKDDEVM